MAKFKVLREHRGDKQYSEGDTRTAEPSVVAHLVDAGILAPVDSGKKKPAAAKKAKTPGNKKAPTPDNKAV
ncbi:hypothetical protein FSZ31_04360 [Sphingorhabdus soli]|uniref:Uncharacterized protein n=1 Tax=Flavisphingopyxis soli TaxID=2601267 RepID=A0A5C6UN36_9SPHN|nr:hypothetical protein [Sphingorhabdus soli]TXC73960.1 hypothetical protein FSZ31_04360 [Sphingorhabdus soli]